MNRFEKVLSNIFNDSSFYGQMLIEDIHNSVVPYSRFSDIPLMVSLHTESAQNLTELVAFGLSGERRNYDLEAALCNFIRRCAMFLFTYGSIYCSVEIEDNAFILQRGQLRRDTLQNFSKIFRIELLRPEHTKRSFSGVYHQERSQSDPRKIEWRLIPKDNLVLFDLNRSRVPWSPFTLVVLKLVDSLKSFTMHPRINKITQMPDFICDIAEQAQLVRLAIALLTSPIGWDARQSFDEYTTAKFKIERQLRYADTLIDLREYILERINDCLGIAGKELNFDVKIEVSGTLLKEDLERLRHEVQSGRKIADVYSELVKRY